MQTKFILLLALIASIKFVYGVPLLNLGDIIGGNGRHVNENGLLHGLNDAVGPVLGSVGVGSPYCDGLLHGLDPSVGPLVNSLGLGVPCIPWHGGNGNGNGNDDGNGKDDGKEKGDENGKGDVNGTGDGNKTKIGKDGTPVNPDGVLKGFNNILKEPLCSVGLGCETCNGILKGANPTLEGPLGALGLGGCEDSGSNKKGCGCHGKKVTIEGKEEGQLDKGLGNACRDGHYDGSNGDGEGAGEGEGVGERVGEEVVERAGETSLCNKCAKKHGTDHGSGGH